MVCIPITNEQPGVAERVRWLGAGEVIRPGRATAARLNAALQAILYDPRYREAAVRCRKKLDASSGVRGAADLIDTAFTTGRRVIAADRPHSK